MDDLVDLDDDGEVALSGLVECLLLAKEGAVTTETAASVEARVLLTESGAHVGEDGPASAQEEEEVGEDDDGEEEPAMELGESDWVRRAYSQCR